MFTPVATDLSGFQLLFNGKDLTGWVNDGGFAEDWLVENGEIVANGRDSRTRSYLLSEREYGDFVLFLEFRQESGAGSGVAVRAIPGEKLPYRKQTIFDHPMIKLLDIPGAEETGTTHWITDNIDVRPDRNAELLPSGSWNQLLITVQGRTMRASVNGKPVLETSVKPGARLSGGLVPALDRSKGRIGLQKHTKTTRFRNIKIREIPADGGLTTGKPSNPGPDISGRKMATEIHDAGQVIFRDDFTNRNTRWPDNQTDHGYSNGCYYIATSATTGWLAPTGYLNKEIRCRIVGRALGNEDSGWGFVFSKGPAGKERGFSVHINRKGELFVKPSFFGGNRFPNDPRIGPIVHESIRKGDAYNTLLLKIRTRRLEIFVNDVQVCDPIEFDWDVTPAYPLLAVFKQNDAAGRAEFTEVEIQELLRNDSGLALDKPGGPGHEEQYVQLLKNRNLKGWTNGLGNASQWNFVEEGVLEGRGSELMTGPAVLHSNDGNFADFKLRLKAQSMDGSTCYLVVRRPQIEATSDKISGYAIAIAGRSSGRGGDVPIGSIAKCLEFAPSAVPSFDGRSSSTVNGEGWHSIEVTATGGLISTTVDGKTEGAQYIDPEATFLSGALAIVCRGASTVRVKDLEILRVGSPPKSTNKVKTGKASGGSLSERLSPGSIWTGSITYPPSAFNGVSAPYYLHVQARDGFKFKGHAFVNGPNRNKVEVEGIVDGDNFEMQENNIPDGKVLWVLQGKFAGDAIKFRFARPGNQQPEQNGEGVFLLRK